MDSGRNLRRQSPFLTDATDWVDSDPSPECSAIVERFGRKAVQDAALQILGYPSGFITGMNEVVAIFNFLKSER